MSYSCGTCGTTGTSGGTCHGKPMERLASVNQSALSRHLLTGAAEAARQAAKATKGGRR